MSKRSVDPVTPIDVSKRHKTELSELVEDDLHSSFLSLDISDLSLLSPLPKDYDDIVDPLTLSNGMYHLTFFFFHPLSHSTRFQILGTGVDMLTRISCWMERKRRISRAL